ncbi:PD40 domain-containing protein, partial [candidate division WOR-3 bacterium]|nr:PD40 domain-containing protein [candidate division WOR-3 bacterium]
MRRAILFNGGVRSYLLTLCMLGLFLSLLFVGQGWAQEIPLTSDSYDHAYPEWSSDGNWIVYNKIDATVRTQIYKVSSTGGTETALTSNSYYNLYPQWSPDGNWIVYNRGLGSSYYQIYKVPS